MAPVGRARLLQLLRGTRKPHEFGSVPGSGARALVADYSPQEPETPKPLDAHSRFRSAMAPSTASAPSLSLPSLLRQLSEIITGYPIGPPSGFARGAASDDGPYPDQKQSFQSPPNPAVFIDLPISQ